MFNFISSFRTRRTLNSAVVLALGASVLIPFFIYQHGFWVAALYYKWFWGLSFLFLIFSMQVAKVSHLSVGVFCAIILLNAWFYSHYRDNSYGYLSPDLYIVLTRIAGTTLVVSLALFSVFFLSKEKLKFIWEFLGLLGVLNSMAIGVQFLKGINPNECGGFLGNPSMSAGFSAFFLPMYLSRLYYRRNYAYLFHTIIITFSVLATKASIPLGVLFSGIFGVYLDVRLLLMAVGVSYLFLGHELLNTSGRLTAWLLMFNDFSHAPWWTWVFGRGAGLSQVFVPMMQEATKQDNEMFIYMHSDILTLLYEFGVLGFCAGLWLYSVLLYKSHKGSALPGGIATLFAMTVMLLLNFPMHSFIHCFAIVLAAALILKEK